MKTDRVVALLAAALVGYSWGVVSYKWDLFPIPLLRPFKEYLTEDRVNTHGFQDTRGREEVACSSLAGSDTAVFVTLGQSNSANHGQSRFSPTGAVFNYNFFDGHCYRARDPLLGATGSGGSVWSRLGELLVTRGIHKTVVVAPIGINASLIARWVPGGDLHWRYRDTVAGLRALGLEPTHILWHQGEADAMAGTDGARYRRFLHDLIAGVRAVATTTPMFIAVASMCHNSGSEPIRRAQQNAVRAFPNVFAGPDSDSLDSLRLRYDGCHFSDDGLAMHAGLWLDALTFPRER
jgi:hypothetical protein